MSYGDLIQTVIFNNLNRLAWKCSNCSRMNECENDGDNTASRYCATIIVAAIKEQKDFNIPYPDDSWPSPERKR